MKDHIILCKLEEGTILQAGFKFEPLDLGRLSSAPGVLRLKLWLGLDPGFVRFKLLAWFVLRFSQIRDLEWVQIFSDHSFEISVPH